MKGKRPAMKRGASSPLPKRKSRFFTSFRMTIEGKADSCQRQVNLDYAPFGELRASRTSGMTPLRPAGYGGQATAVRGRPPQSGAGRHAQRVLGRARNRSNWDSTELPVVANHCCRFSPSPVAPATGCISPISPGGRCRRARRILGNSQNDPLPKISLACALQESYHLGAGYPSKL